MNPNWLDDPDIQRLLATERHLQGLINSARDAVVAMDDQGLVTDWNPAAESMLGWRRDEALGQRLSELIIPPALREAHENGFRARLAAPLGTNRLVEVQAQHRDGHLIDVELSLWSLQHGDTSGFGAFIRNLSERNAAQAAIRQSEERYRLLVEHLSEGMGIIQDGLTVYVNPKAVEIIRRPPEMMLGHSFLDWIHPDDHAMVADRQRRRQLGENVPAHYELRCLHLDGSVRWLETHASMVPWEGRPATMTFFSDVTERRAMREAVAQSEARYRAVIEHLGEGMMVIQDGVIVFTNSRVSDILRLPPDTLIGMHSVDVLHPEDREAVVERQRRRDRGEDVPTHVELRRLDADGTVRWLDTHSTTITWEGRSATMSFFSDITDRKQMLEALQHSEERYRIVIEHVGEGMVVVQGEHFVFVNRRATEIVQMSREDMLREGYMHRIHPEDQAIVQERRRRRLAGLEVPNRYEIRLLLPNGEVRWIDIGVTLVPWEGGQGTLTFFSDVTPRKLLEQQLQQTLQERETILENSMVGIAFLTPKGRFRWANRAMFQIFGTTPQARDFSSMEEVYPTREDYLRVGGEVSQAILEGRVYETEMRMRRLDGSHIWVFMSGKAVSRTDLNQGTVWSILDITQRKALENTLQRTSSERQAILDNALVGIAYSVQRRLQWVNHKFAEMLGQAREALIGQSTLAFFVDEAEWLQLGEESVLALSTTGTFTAERQMRRHNGELFWVQMSGRCVVGQDPEQGVIWTLLDITRRKQAEEETLAALQQQRELNDLRSRFVAMTSHEFRTPLATILSSTELLRHYSDRLPESEKAEIFDSIESSVRRMTLMLDRVLVIGKVDAQMLTYAPRPLVLSQLCHTLTDEVRTQHPQAVQRLQTELALTDEPRPWDESLLRHMLVNLLSNAIKYSPDGGVVLLKAFEDGETTVLQVIDQGIGIPQDELDHLFESFHRASNVGTIQGTGLGLAIVKKSVELHGGSIAVESQVGHGTCFTIRL